MMVIKEHVISVSYEYKGDTVTIRDCVDDADLVKIFATGYEKMTITVEELAILNECITKYLELKVNK